MKTVRIGTRKSQLALWQANFVSGEIQKNYSNVAIELVEIISAGDKTLDIPLSQVGGKGLFLKELEIALLEGEVDLAVHSMKDVTVELPDGLHIPVVCARDDPRDSMVSNHFESLDALDDGAVVGTCSLRRQCQLRSQYPKLQFENLRGNVNTRLAKLDAGDFTAIILAVAGLKRLKLENRIQQYIDPSVCLPAVGQGIVGIECRIEDLESNELIAVLNDKNSEIQITAERAANKRLGGGCHVPIAVYSEILGDELKVKAMVGEIDGSKILLSEKKGPIADAELLGNQVAEDLLNQGAGEILASVYENA